MLTISTAVETGYAQSLIEAYLFTPKRHLVGWAPDLHRLLEYGKEHPEEARIALESAEIVLRVLDILADGDPKYLEYAQSLLKGLAMRLLAESDGRRCHEEQSGMEVNHD